MVSRVLARKEQELTDMRVELAKATASAENFRIGHEAQENARVRLETLIDIIKKIVAGEKDAAIEALLRPIPYPHK